jgi:hypothetical protein
MQDPRALLEATDYPPDVKWGLVVTDDKLMNAILQNRDHVSDQDRADIGMLKVRAISEIASTGQRDPNQVYEYALSRAQAASSTLRWRF